MTHTPTFRAVLIAVALSLTLVGTLGCEKEKKTVKSPRSSTAVELPKKPVLKMPDYVKQHADGVWTVEGLIRNNKEAMSKTAKVRGKIVELNLCPPPEPYTEAQLAAHTALMEKYHRYVKLAKKRKKLPPDLPVLKEKKQARTCNPRPRAMLVDDPPNDRFKLLVAGSMYSPLKNFKPGQVVTIEGMFDMVTPDGFYMQQDGLIHLKDLPEEKEEPVVEAPGEAPPEPTKDKKKKKKKK